MTNTMKGTFELAAALTNCRLAKQKFENIIRDYEPRFQSKKYVQDSIRKLGSIEKDLVALMGTNVFKEVMKQQLLNDEWSGQIEVINDMLFDMPKKIRDEVEAYTEQRYRLYATNKEVALS